MDTSKWQIIKCFYDPSGISSNEIEAPERYLYDLKDSYGDPGHIIGQVFMHNGKNHVKTILEGEKDILKFILKELKS